ITCEVKENDNRHQIEVIMQTTQGKNWCEGELEIFLRKDKMPLAVNSGEMMSLEIKTQLLSDNSGNDIKKDELMECDKNPVKIGLSGSLISCKQRLMFKQVSNKPCRISFETNMAHVTPFVTKPFIIVSHKLTVIKDVGLSAPEYKWYKDEGGKHNNIQCVIGIKDKHNEILNNLTVRIPIQLTLVYDNSSHPPVSNQEILSVDPSCGSMELNACGKLTISFRIEQISSPSSLSIDMDWSVVGLLFFFFSNVTLPFTFFLFCLFTNFFIEKNSYTCPVLVLSKRNKKRDKASPPSNLECVANDSSNTPKTREERIVSAIDHAKQVLLFLSQRPCSSDFDMTPSTTERKAVEYICSFCSGKAPHRDDVKHGSWCKIHQTLQNMESYHLHSVDVQPVSQFHFLHPCEGWGHSYPQKEELK
ncbi:hypothetical protein RFI_10600, partial [Reticulomyxa filosa]